jgi:hypothetical protein
MSTRSDGSVAEAPKRVRERSVSDVAREAFENRLIEGDDVPPKRNRLKAEGL